MTEISISGYANHNPGLDASHDYLLPTVLAAIGRPAPGARLFDLGCGNGAVAEHLTGLGWAVSGVDPSESGIAYAHAHRSGLDVHLGSAYDDLAARFGTFERLVSLEVVEHVYAPRHFARTAFSLLKPGGIAVFSTPYHGYWKNLAIALAGKFDSHATALWDHGHIKFWSIATLGTLLAEAGFCVISWHRVGRVPALAKSMIAVAERPSA